MAEYLTHPQALHFISECEQRGRRILGMEFFLRAEDSITPVGGTAWETLLSEQPQTSWREARELLRHGIPNGGNAVLVVTE